MPNGEPIPLDPVLLKVLSSETRIGILKLLKTRRMTLSEMAKALNLKKATILEHLEKLTKADLIRRHEDERLWVYYGLTRRGGHVITPGVAVFQLFVAAAVASVVVAAAFVVVFQLFPGGPTGASPSPGPLALETEDAALYAGAPVAFDARFTDAGKREIDAAYLLPSPSAAELRDGASQTTGFPLDVEPDADSDVLRFSAGGTVGAGTYYLYVRDDEGRDNRDALVPIASRDVSVEPSHDRWWLGLDDHLEVNASVDGAPAEGTLRIAPRSEWGAKTSLSATVSSGKAVFEAAFLDTLGDTELALSFLPAGDAREVLALARVELSEPGIAVTPLHVAEGVPEAISVVLQPGFEASAPVRIARDGIEIASQSVWESGLLPLAAQAPGTVQVAAGRRPPMPVTVHADLDLSIEETDSGIFRLVARTIGGGPVAGATVFLNESFAGATDGNGSVSLSIPLGGHETRVVRPDGAVVRRVLAFDGSAVTAAVVRLEPTVAGVASYAGGSAVVLVVVENSLPSPVPATLRATLSSLPASNLANVASAGMMAPPRAPVVVELRFPSVSPGRYRLDVVADPLVTAPISLPGGVSSRVEAESLSIEIELPVPPPTYDFWWADAGAQNTVLGAREEASASDGGYASGDAGQPIQDRTEVPASDDGYTSSASRAGGEPWNSLQAEFSDFTQNDDSLPILQPVPFDVALDSEAPRGARTPGPDLIAALAAAAVGSIAARSRIPRRP